MEWSINLGDFYTIHGSHSGLPDTIQDPEIVADWPISKAQI